MGKKKVKIVFVGVGAMGQCAHLKNYVLVPDCEVVAICEIREKLGLKVAQKYGIKKFYKDFEEMRKNEEFDGIVAPQPFTRHYTILKQLLKTKLPIFIEKPLASSVETGKKILEEIERAKTWVMVGYHKRSDLATIYAKEKIENFNKSGEIGKMKYIRITIPPGNWIAGGFKDLITTDEKLPPLEFDTIVTNMSDNEFKEYVEFVNYYIHQVNLMRHLMGENYNVKFADKSKTLMVVSSKSGGIPGIIEMAPYSTSISWDEKATVFFEKGYVEISFPSPLVSNIPGKVKIFKDFSPPITFIPQLPWIDAMYNQAVNFVKAIKGEAKAPCYAEESLQDLLIAEEYFYTLRQ